MTARAGINANLYAYSLSGKDRYKQNHLAGRYTHGNRIISSVDLITIFPDRWLIFARGKAGFREQKRII